MPNTKAAAAVLPDAKAFGEHTLLVPHNVRNTLLLRHIGFKDVPSAVMHYDYRGGNPFDVQRKTVEMMVENPHAYILNHMGTGKTKSALWAWDFLHSQDAARKLLVVAPLSTLNFVWAREIFATLPGKKVRVLHGTRQDRLDRLGEEADIYIINHDGLKTIYESLQTRPDIDTLVLDELAVYRNNSDRSKLMRRFAQKFEIVWGMTGSPMPNEPVDVWGQCKIVTPHTVPKYRQQAKELLMTRVSQYKWLPKSNAVDMAHRMMQPAVRYALDDVVELPELVSRTIDVELSAHQKQKYDQFARDLTVMVANKQVTAVNAGAAMQKLLQITGGWVYTTNPDFVRLDASPRIAALIDLIQSVEQKVIVFVPYRHAIEGISGIFRQAQGGLRPLHRSRRYTKP